MYTVALRVHLEQPHSHNTIRLLSLEVHLSTSSLSCLFPLLDRTVITVTIISSDLFGPPPALCSPLFLQSQSQRLRYRVNTGPLLNASCLIQYSWHRERSIQDNSHVQSQGGLAIYDLYEFNGQATASVCLSSPLIFGTSSSVKQLLPRAVQSTARIIWHSVSTIRRYIYCTVLDITLWRGQYEIQDKKWVAMSAVLSPWSTTQLRWTCTTGFQIITNSWEWIKYKIQVGVLKTRLPRLGFMYFVTNRVRLSRPH